MHDGQVLDDREFIEVLKEEQLTAQLQETILYALAFADRSGGSMTYAQGMEALAQYKRSADRYMSVHTAH